VIRAFRPFRPEPEASAELEDAAVWYESQWSGLGLEFVEAVDAALQQVARWPQIGRRVPGVPNDVPARRFPVNRFPYYIAYLEWNDVIRLLAFAHDSRKPGYWFSRINR
jgi:plasmid stabilization system protein ParE